mmetsp:Transcript_146465/g.408037  ORF Transcript_146465/g.408037 Transcript_146465/m.408037 type:complete len:211 (-) Transcript_146465:51-683(-)
MAPSTACHGGCEGANAGEGATGLVVAEELALQGDTLVRGRVLRNAELGVNLQEAVGAGANLDVPDVQPRRSSIRVHRAGDPCKPPHVLVLEVSASAPAEDLQCEDVAPPAEVGRQPELDGQLAVGTEAELMAIEPRSARGAHGPDVQEDLEPPLQPQHGRLELPTVGTCRVVLGVLAPVRNVRRVQLEDVIDVGVNREAKAVELPVAWHW